jgi:hypothetical protein
MQYSNTVYLFMPTDCHNSFLNNGMKIVIDKILTSCLIFTEYVIKLNAMWQHGADNHAYVLHHAIPWQTQRWKCMLIKFLPTYNFHGKYD